MKMLLFRKKIPAFLILLFTRAYRNFPYSNLQNYYLKNKRENGLSVKLNDAIEK